MAMCIDVWQDEDGSTWAAFLDDNGIAYTAKGLPNQDEVDHVNRFHAGELCPVIRITGRACAFNIKYDPFRGMAICHDPGLAGTW